MEKKQNEQNIHKNNDEKRAYYVHAGEKAGTTKNDARKEIGEKKLQDVLRRAGSLWYNSGAGRWLSA